MSTQVPPLFMLMHKGSRKPKKNLGVLEIKPCQGRGLRVVQKIGKQDPYIQIEHGVRSQRTKADKNGGQKPRWEDNFKFDIFEGDTIVRVQCLDQNLRDSSLIGQRTIDFAPVLRSYQWDGWFGLTSQGECAGDVYLEFTYYPGPDIPKPVNPPKPAVHRVTLTPAEILNQMKESEDALPPLQHKDSNESPTDAEKGPCKKIIESPKSESSVDTIRDELSSMKLDANISTTSLPNIQRGNSPKIHPQASPHHYEKLPHHAQMNHTHSIAHRNSEPIIYPNGHFYPHSEMGSSESLSSPYMMSPPSQIPRMGGVHSSGRLPSKPASLGGPGSPHLTVDRRRSKLIGPRRANSTPQEHLRESSQLPRRDTPSPSPSQLSYEYTPTDYRHSYPYLPEFPTDPQRSPYSHGYSSPQDSWAVPQFPSSPFPPPPPGVEYPVGPAFMVPPHMYSDPSFYDENFRPRVSEAVAPADCR